MNFLFLLPTQWRGTLDNYYTKDVFTEGCSEGFHHPQLQTFLFLFTLLRPPSIYILNSSTYCV